MHYVGIDLAWGTSRPTGLAVLDRDARLRMVGAVTTDDEVVDHLEPWVAGECLVAVDAPLVVRNQTGSRPAEKALTADFRRFDAGTHPTNLSRSEFAEGSRGARVCRLLGLDLDPRSGRPRRAIEVYPHAATVVLFSLEAVLRYKHKRGRDLELLRSELLRLMSHVESVVTTDETWAGLRAQVEQATRKSELRRVEDQVDAVVCAYVALFADTRPDRTTTYGDPETGAIVTPSLGAQQPLAPDESTDAVGAYTGQHDELVAAGDAAVALVRSILDEAGINYLSVTGRTKSVRSFAEKAGRTRGGIRLYDDPLSQITDQLGVRVITYVRDDVDAVAELLGEQVIVQDDRDLGRETASEGRFGYASRHLLVTVDPAREGREDLVSLRGRVVQVQVRTVLQHAWAEFEHDIRYKGTVPTEHAGEFDRRFTLAAGLLELADREFSLIRDRLRGVAPDLPTTEDDDDRLDPRELSAFLAGQYHDAGRSRAEHYRWISGLLLELGITDFDALGEVLHRADEREIARRMDYRHPPGAVRRLDDSLLWVHGEAWVTLDGNAHRPGPLRARLERMRGA